MTLLLFLILVAVAVLASLLGGGTGYYYYRARHRETAEMLERLAMDLQERDRMSRGSQMQGTSASDPRIDGELRDLRVKLEQKKNECQILRQDFEVETRVLNEENEQMKQRLSGTGKDHRRLERQAHDLEKDRVELQRDRERAASIRTEIEQVKSALRGERAELDRVRRHLQERESRLDDRILSIPLESFSSRQEGLLIRRLREEIKRQRQELETMHASHSPTMRSEPVV